MVQFILMLSFLLSGQAQAQFFGMGGSGSTSKLNSQIPEIVSRLKKLEMKTTPGFEDVFNKGVKEIELQVEEEKLFCSGEATDAQGKTLPKDQKQLCFRELKKHYLSALEMIFAMKKQYLGLLHNQHLERLTEIQKKLQANIEKNF